MKGKPLFTEVIKQRYEEIKAHLSRKDIDISLKTSRLRIIAREIASKLTENKWISEYR